MKIFWNKQRTAELIRLYPQVTVVKLAEHFGTTRAAVAQKAYKLGLRKCQPSKIKLTHEQTSWMKRNYPHMSNEICATYLGISISTLHRNARRFRLAKTPQFMRDCHLHAASKARESHIRNGTYPPKGFIVPGSEKYRFKPRHSNTTL